jgi:hypothetical protein
MVGCYPRGSRGHPTLSGKPEITASRPPPPPEIEEHAPMPEPVLLSIATAVVTKAVTGLYELVKAKFSDDPVATAALEAAEAAGEGSPEADRLGDVLAEAERTDPEFGERLRGAWERSEATVTQTGHIANSVSNSADAKVVQTGTVAGDVNFH